MAAGAFAAIVPPHGQGFYLRCPLYEATGVLCPICGATRAVSALASGHLGAALHDNVLLVAAVPVLVVLWLGWMARSVGGRPLLSRLRWPPALTPYAAVVAVVFGVLRNLPFGPFHALVPLA